MNVSRRAAGASDSCLEEVPRLEEVRRQGAREGLEGATVLFVVVVLFWVGYWLLSRLEQAKWEGRSRARS